LSPFQQAIDRMALKFLSVHPQRPYVVAFIAISRGNGVSTVAAAFAHRLAQSGPTLLVDAAVRSVQSGDAVPRFGLLQSIQRNLPADFAINKGGQGEADVLHCGLAEPADFVLLSKNHAIEAAFSELQSRYGIIVLDTGATVAEPQGQKLLAVANSALLILAPDELTGAKSGAAQSGIVLCAGKIEATVVNKVGLDVYEDEQRRSANLAPSGTIPAPQFAGFSE
jgi:MinD-like ATPase involved in chromosome partitioning or flagellar assembly